MENADFVQYVQTLANDILVWIGFGTVVGLLAKAIMPGRDPGGAVATLAMGVAGTVIGCGAVTFFYEGHRITPISILGLVAGTAGAFVLLAFYRLLGGRWFVEGQTRPHNLPRRPFFSRYRRTRTRHVEHL